MRCPDAIPDEEGRLQALADHGLSAGVAVPSLDPIVDIAVRLFGVPAAAANMIGSDHVFFAASAGIGETDMGRDVSFCAHAITQDEVMVVADAREDPRFHDNPIVMGGKVRFYAGVPLRSPSGHALGALCILDIEPREGFGPEDRARLRDLGRMASEKLELRRLEVANDGAPSEFAAIASTSPYAVICFDTERRITAWNPAAVEMFGYGASEAMSCDIALLVSEPELVRIQEAMHRVLNGGGAPTKETSRLTARRKDGSLFPAELSWSHWRLGNELHFGAIVQDVTHRVEQADALHRLANFDSLTGLANRNLLHERGAEALATGEPAAMVTIDLDGFKDVNDTLGHAVGDALLTETGRKLIEAVPPGATVARIGGDEFAIVLPGAGDPLRLAMLAEELIAAITRPTVIDGHEIRIAGSCGLAIAPQHGETVEALLGSADLALFQAKAGGRGRWLLFMPSLRAEAVARRMYDAELHRAVERNELQLHYQPLVRLADGGLVGAEALIRWAHPVRHLLHPAAFLPALEGGPLAATVGTWVLDAACAQARIWRRTHPDFRMSVNLFAAQFRADDLPTLVAETLARHALPAEALKLEITENIVLDQVELVLPQLDAIRALGVALAFDDFGTGYASLNLLKNYPISHIKIDKSFVQAMDDSPHDRAIVSSLIGLSHQLSLAVIAEGIETDAQRAFLRAQDCEEGQGFLFGKPMAADLFAAKFALAQNRASALA